MKGGNSYGEIPAPARLPQPEEGGRKSGFTQRERSAPGRAGAARFSHRIAASCIKLSGTRRVGCWVARRKGHACRLNDPHEQELI